MPLQITSTNLKLRQDSVDLAKEKVLKVEKFLKDYGEELKELRVVIDKGPRFGFVTKIELFVPSTSFVAKAGGFSLEGSIDESVEDLERQINKFKGKVFTKNRGLLRGLKRRIFLGEE